MHTWPAEMALSEEFHMPARRELKSEKRKLLKERSEELNERMIRLWTVTNSQ